MFGADVSIFLAQSDEAAFIYFNEIGGEPVGTAPQLKTNAEGFFEFWIGDSSEKNGYSTTQKFKITWERIGIESGMIDYVDVFPVTLPVDETDDDREKNKCVSNLLAKNWQNHINNESHIVHGIDEINLDLELPIRNKLISNTLGIRWQDHRRYSFNKNAVVPPEASDEELALWEDPNNFEKYGGAHGLMPVQFDKEPSDFNFNRLISNMLGNKWNSHVEFNFLEDDILSADSAHGLKPADPEMDINESTASEEELKEYRSYNKLVSNKIMKDIINRTEAKAEVINRKIRAQEWSLSMKEDVYFYKITHELKSENIGLTMYQLTDRINEDGETIQTKSIVSPKNVFILSDSEIELQTTNPVDTSVMLWSKKNQSILENE